MTDLERLEARVNLLEWKIENPSMYTKGDKAMGWVITDYRAETDQWYYTATECKTGNRTTFTEEEWKGMSNDG